MNIQGLEISILGPAFLAGLLVLFSHVPLGIEVLKRGIIFVDLAIAQFAGLGAIAASIYFHESPHEILLNQLCAFAAATSGALILTWTEKYFAKTQEAIIGCSFVLSSCIALLLLTNNPHGAEHMKDLLAGQILWVSLKSLIPVALIYTVTVPVWLIYGKRLNRIGFYLLFAVTVTVSVQLVGVYLVFSSLIIPALATVSIKRNRLIYAWLIGTIGLISGLVASAILDLPSGPTIVCALALAGLISTPIKNICKG